jgi:tetratricopeptide (TPR) repeat protein
MTLPGAPEDATRTAIGAARMLASGTLLAGRYRIGGLLGVGAMGMVYRARDEQLGVEVAVKVLRAERAADEGLRERFRQELVLARQVTHRNVVRIHDIGTDGEIWFLTMDLVEGRSMRQVLEEDGRLEPAAVLDLGRQLAAALAAAHAEGVVHRDLKPANVLLADGRAYVTDFGIARSIAATGLTASGQVVGTPDYLAPEQARGDAVDGRTDLYALGLILFEALTGELPFRGGTLSEMLAQRVAGRPRRAAELGVDVPPELERVVARCLERDPDDRYRDAGDLLADLDRLAAGGRIRRRRGPALRRLAPWAAGITAGVAALAALALTAGALWSRRSPAETAAGGAAAGVPAPTHAVAVLPLADETGRPDLAWIATGVAERIAESLAESPDLRVVDPARVARTLDDLKLGPRTGGGGLAEPELRLIAELLDADRLVAGRVLSHGARVRVEARLIAPGGSVPAAGVDAEAADASEVWGLAERLADELRRRLGAEAPASLPPEPGAGAFEAYARGLEAQHRGDLDRAAEALAEAVGRDPGFAAAWQALAGVDARRGRLPEATAAAERAAETAGPAGGRLSFASRARAARLAGEPDRSGTLLAEQVAAYPHDEVARLALGESLGAAGLFDDARRVLGELAAADPNHARAWYLLGRFAISSGDLRRARDEYLVRALGVYSRLGDRRGRADTLNALGAAAQELGEPAEAVDYYRRAAELRRELDDRSGLAQTLTNLAYVESLTGDYAAAVAGLEQALALREELGDRAGIGRCLNLRGILEEQRGRYREALDHHRRALALREGLGDRQALAESHSSVGFASLVLGDHAAAGEHFERALALFREGGDQAGEAFALQNRGQLELARGEWPAALRSSLDALELARGLELTLAEALALANLGRVAQHQGRYAAALDSYAQALERIETLGDPRGLAELTLYRADALVELGMLGEAEEGLERVRGWLAAGGAREQRADLARLEAELALALGRSAAAAAAVDRAESEAVATDAPPAALAVEVTRGRVELAAGSPAAAASRLRRTLEQAERLGHRPLALDAAAALAEAELAAGRPAAAAEVARVALAEVAAAGSWSGAFRLHLVLAEALGEQGDGAAAAGEMARAREQVERLRRDLGGPALEAFGRLPAVERIDDARLAAA